MRKRTTKKIVATLEEMCRAGIKYKLAHSHVYHAWIKENRKCNVYTTTQTWKSFDNKHKDVGVESLLRYLLDKEEEK